VVKGAEITGFSAVLARLRKRRAWPARPPGDSDNHCNRGGKSATIVGF